ncbi:NADH:flavin oxidoreductase [Pseudaquidulcibacter saccharophilus]|uniref:NADH:flavin oxidoreductase n=1 Tax=Pseudaquidulcibacter saccharophilus TaxID=2831900 RepID=UPI001EFF2CD2|nr:NADH:flavin oxidoreductase [Pseudaquidulcibacter saccharophilus]
MPNSALFKPFEFKSIKSKNRIAMAPMTRTMAPNGIPGEANAAYYERRAKGGVGLIITEGTVIDRPGSKMAPDVPNFFGAAMDGWKNVVEKVHAAGGQIVPQIWHVGNVGMAKGWEPSKIDSPSGYIMPDKQNTEPMTEEDIADTIAKFAESAKAAKDVGFDGIELHGAHGYLIDQFFWKELNKRTDKWGGATIKERNAFAEAVIKACRAAVGDDFAIIIRISQWKQQDYEARLATTPDEMTEWLGGLVDAGADILHCSQRRFWTPEFEGSDLNFAGWAKKLLGVPTISVGSVGLDGEFLGAFRGQGSEVAPIDGLIKRIENDEFDMIAVGRALLSDPEWVAKIKENRAEELQAFDRRDLAVLK